MPDETHSEIPKKYMLGFYSMLLALGLIIYVSWGLMYDSWNIFTREHLGIYSMTIVLCGFGIVGLLLYSIKGKEE